ncbi:MAG: hypothetical protein ACYSTS_00960 [Planctomycetota bacterium]
MTFLQVGGEIILPDGLFGRQVSITMSKCINGRLPARIGTRTRQNAVGPAKGVAGRAGGNPFRYSLLVCTVFMKKNLL